VQGLNRQRIIDLAVAVMQECCKEHGGAKVNLRKPQVLGGGGEGADSSKGGVLQLTGQDRPTATACLGHTGSLGEHTGSLWDRTRADTSCRS
jgi:hypothetical protein